MTEATEKQKLIDGWADSLSEGGRHRDVANHLEEIWDAVEKIAIRDFIGRLHVISDHLVEDVGHHTCGTGPDGHYGAHEPGCGYEMITPLKDITQEIR